MLRIPAIKCSPTTTANVYQTSMKIHDLIPYLLGLDPRSQNWKYMPADIRAMYETLQRKTSKQRRDSIVRYYSGRMAPGAMWIGAIPPIVVGMRIEQPFVPYDRDDNELVGYLKVQTRFDRPNILLDGLGRVTGYLDMMDDEQWRAWAGEAVVPVMLVTPPDGKTELSLDELGQLFHDMNTLATPVGKGQAVDLDKSDLYIQTTNKISSLAIIASQGGSDDRAVSIPKNGQVWTTKTVLLKAVRAASEGPGSHVDHIRDNIDSAYLQGPREQATIVNRFDEALTTFVKALPGQTVPIGQKTLLRTATWWVAFGLVLHDLHASYEGSRIGEQEREAMLHRMAAIDWSLGNPDFSFLGNSVDAKDTGQKPVDDQGRPLVNQFFGGAKAYYNLAAYIRQRIGLKAKVSYGPEYGTSLIFNEDGSIAASAIAAE